MYALVIATLFQVPAAAAPAAAFRRGDYFKEATSGLRYIWGNPPLRTPMLLALVPVLLAMPYHSLMPVFSKDAFGVGSEGLGFLMGAGGAGALIGSLLVAFFSEHPNKNRLQIITGVLFGGSLMALAIAPVFPLGLAAMLAVGGASSTYLALNNTIILTNCDPKMHGRVMSIYFTTFGLMPISTLPMSAAADALGIRWTLGAAGVLTAAFVAVTSLALRDARNARPPE